MPLLEQDYNSTIEFSTGAVIQYKFKKEGMVMTIQRKVITNAPNTTSTTISDIRLDGQRMITLADDLERVNSLSIA